MNLRDRMMKSIQRDSYQIFGFSLCIQKLAVMIFMEKKFVADHYGLIKNRK
ncbi:hypothetical protein [Lachnoclostridium sp.]|uniref:hypothetical protein n=1 Tax=Lachnoclostridium sp. TaxID=2028282 RepID=UPI0028A00C81|nr:hypothetical protein [Lachnoclostridium sp.]